MDTNTRFPDELSAPDRKSARELWRALMSGAHDAREQLDAAPASIRAAIGAASKAVLRSGDEPDASDDANPFR